MVNVPQLARPHQSNFGSHFLGYTCWPFVFYCLWFPKLVLRGTYMEMNGRSSHWGTDKPPIDWFIMFPWVSDSQELHLKVKARNEAAALLQNKNLCSARLFLTGKRELSAGPKHTDESHVTDATKTGKCFKCLWLNIIFNLRIKVRLHSLRLEGYFAQLNVIIEVMFLSPGCDYCW